MKRSRSKGGGCAGPVAIAVGIGGAAVTLPALGASPDGPPTVIRVDADAGPGGDGTTWPTAFRFLKDAIDAAEAIPPPRDVEIRVAEGVYVPDRDEQNPAGSGLRTATFRLLNGVVMRGGFAGLGAADPDVRDLAIFDAVLTGDLAGDDGPDFANNAENCHHVVTGMGGTGSPVLDGFVITGGNADAFFTGSFGAGFFNFDAFGLPIVISCRFVGNRAADSGGAVATLPDRPVKLVNCTFSGNEAGVDGGAVYAERSLTTLRGCSLTENTTGASGGGALIILDTCYQIGDQAVNCVLWGNHDNDGTTEASQISVIWLTCPPEAPDGPGGDPFTYCCVQGWQGIGVGNVGDDPRPVDPDGADDVLGTPDDDLRLFVGSPCIDAGNNAAVPPEAGGLDADGAARFVDDPNTPDSGSGTPPIVDIGAYEFVPIGAGAPGPRLWNDPAGGVFTDDADWIPDAPGAADAAVFDLPAAYAITFPRPVTTDRLLVIDGDVTLDLGGTTYTLLGTSEAAVTIGPYVGAGAALTVDAGTIAASTVRVSEAGGGELRISGPGIVSATDEVLLDGGRLTGVGTVQGDLTNLGEVAPGLGGIGTLTVSGDYRQVPGSPGVPANGNLTVEISGGAGPASNDLLAVTGTATLGGGLVVEFAGGAQPEVGASFPVVTSAARDGVFEVALLPALDGDHFMFVTYGPPAAAGGDGAAVEVGSLTLLFGGFQDPDSVPIAGLPTGAVTGDFDGDGAPDLAVTIRGSTPQVPGSALVLLNDGAGGFTNVQQIAVGLEPTDITTAPLNADAALDLAVSNAGDDTVSIILNQGNGTFDPAASLPVGAAGKGVPDALPAAIGAGDFNGDGVSDLAVALFGQDTVSVLGNDGNAGFIEIESLMVGGGPCALDPEDLDDDKDTDLVVPSCLANLVTVITQGMGGGFDDPVEFGVGDTPVDVATDDLDGNGLPDIVTTNAGDDTVSILVNGGGGAFGSALTLPVGGQPRSITTLDLEPDGDRDIALVANDALGGAVVQILRNDRDPRQGPQLIFAAAAEISSPEEPVLVLSDFLDGNAVEDLIVVSAGAGDGAGDGGGDRAPGPVGTVTVRLDACANCGGDFDGDCAVGFADLLVLLGAWGPCPAPCPPECEQDLDDDCAVGFSDLLALLGVWGSCG